MWETQKIRVVKAGTLEKLVESLVTVKGELDSTYVNVFLATYRTFATPLQVLEILIKRCVSNGNSVHYNYDLVVLMKMTKLYCNILCYRYKWLEKDSRDHEERRENNENQQK